MNDDNGKYSEVVQQVRNKDLQIEKLEFELDSIENTLNNNKSAYTQSLKSLETQIFSQQDNINDIKTQIVNAYQVINNYCNVDRSSSNNPSNDNINELKDNEEDDNDNISTHSQHRERGTIFGSNSNNGNYNFDYLESNLEKISRKSDNKHQQNDPNWTLTMSRLFAVICKLASRYESKYRECESNNEDMTQKSLMLSSYTRDFATLEKEFDSVKLQLNESETLLLNKTTLLGEMKKQLAINVKTNENLCNQLTAHQKQTEQLQHRCDTFKTTFEKIGELFGKENINENESKLDHLSDGDGDDDIDFENENIKKQGKYICDSIAQLRNDIVDAGNDSNRNKQVSITLKNLLNTMTQQCEEMNEAMVNMQNEMINPRFDNFVLKLSQLQEKIGAMIGKNDEIEINYRKERKQCESLKNQLDQYVNENTELNRLYQEEQAKRQQMETQLEQENDDLKHQIAILKRDAAIMQENIEKRQNSRGDKSTQTSSENKEANKSNESHESDQSECKETQTGTANGTTKTRENGQNMIEVSDMCLRCTQQMMQVEQLHNECEQRDGIIVSLREEIDKIKNERDCALNDFNDIAKEWNVIEARMQELESEKSVIEATLINIRNWLYEMSSGLDQVSSMAHDTTRSRTFIPSNNSGNKENKNNQENDKTAMQTIDRFVQDFHSLLRKNIETNDIENMDIELMANISSQLTNYVTMSCSWLQSCYTHPTQQSMQFGNQIESVKLTRVNHIAADNMNDNSNGNNDPRHHDHREDEKETTVQKNDRNGRNDRNDNATQDADDSIVSRITSLEVESVIKDIVHNVEIVEYFSPSVWSRSL